MGIGRKLDTGGAPRAWILTLTLLATDWVGDTAPYTQTITAPDISVWDYPDAIPLFSDDIPTALIEQEEWHSISEAETFDGYIVFTCFEYKPGVDLAVQLKVDRVAPST